MTIRKVMHQLMHRPSAVAVNRMQLRFIQVMHSLLENTRQECDIAYPFILSFLRELFGFEFPDGIADVGLLDLSLRIHIIPVLIRVL
jgi:hypothetical protein